MIPLINLKDIHYLVGSKTVLHIPEFSINPGELLGIMGPNGAGKSTLLRVLSLLENPSSGSINYHGEKVTGSKIPISLRRKFSIALQQSLLLDTSVTNNIAIGLRFRKVEKEIINEKAAWWMDKFQISHLAKKNALHLSGGEAQRVNLARAMIIEPEILFLDEPFSALDFPTKIRLLEDFKLVLESTKTTAVFVSHDLMEVQYLTNLLAVMEKGEIIQTGLTADVINHPNEKAAAFLNVWKSFSLINAQ
jgi:tungstate transport system ATP-binding protein